MTFCLWRCFLSSFPTWDDGRFSFSLAGWLGKGNCLPGLYNSVRSDHPPRNVTSYKTFLEENRCIYLSMTLPLVFVACVTGKNKKTKVFVFLRLERLNKGLRGKSGLEVTFLLHVRFPGSLPARFHRSIISSEPRKQKRGAVGNFVTFS